VSLGAQARVGGNQTVQHRVELTLAVYGKLGEPVIRELATTFDFDEASRA
jgi:hypothetical protein